MEKEQYFQQRVLKLLDVHMQKDEAGNIPHTIHKKITKWIKDINIKANMIKISEEKIRVNC